MLAKVNSYGILGITGYPVTVEVDVANGLPMFDIVGLPEHLGKGIPGAGAQRAP